MVRKRAVRLIGSMSPWVLPERTLGTVRYIETYPGNYLICRTVPCLLSTVPWLSLFRPLLMSQYLKYTCTDRQASYLYKVGLEYETVKPRRNFNLYTLMRAILLQISRWSGMRVSFRNVYDISAHACTAPDTSLDYIAVKRYASCQQSGEGAENWVRLGVG